MAAQWTPERRAQQSEAIERWKPWESSTGPVSLAGRIRSSRNAYKGAQRQQMQWLRAVLREQAGALRDLG